MGKIVTKLIYSKYKTSEILAVTKALLSNATNVSDGWNGGWGEGDEEDEDGEARMTSAS